MSKIEELFYKIDGVVESNISKSNYLQELANCLEFKNDADFFDIVDNYSKEDIRKVYNFLVLKAFRKMQNVNYNITPKIVSNYLSFIIDEISFGHNLDILDLASGSGSIFINMDLSNKNITSVDIDSSYVKLQKNICNLLEIKANIFNQDALKLLNISKQDIVVSDVPYGYYFDEDNSLNFKLCSNEGYSLNALLFLEQAVNYLKDDGVALLILPKQIMELSDKLKKFIETDININSFILLPEKMFKNKEQQKVILIASKKCNKRLPSRVFLAEIPSYQNRYEFDKFKLSFKNFFSVKK